MEAVTRRVGDRADRADVLEDLGHRDQVSRESGTVEPWTKNSGNRLNSHTLQSEDAGVARGVLGGDLHVLAIRGGLPYPADFSDAGIPYRLKIKKKFGRRGLVCVFCLLVEKGGQLVVCVVVGAKVFTDEKLIERLQVLAQLVKGRELDVVQRGEPLDLEPFKERGAVTGPHAAEIARCP